MPCAICATRQYLTGGMGNKKSPDVYLGTELIYLHSLLNCFHNKSVQAFPSGICSRLNFLFGRADLFFEDEVYPVIRFGIPFVVRSGSCGSHYFHLAFCLYYIPCLTLAQVYNMHLRKYKSLCSVRIVCNCAMVYTISCEQEERKGGRP